MKYTPFAVLALALSVAAAPAPTPSQADHLPQGGLNQALRNTETVASRVVNVPRREGPTNIPHHNPHCLDRHYLIDKIWGNHKDYRKCREVLKDSPIITD